MARVNPFKKFAFLSFYDPLDVKLPARGQEKEIPMVLVTQIPFEKGILVVSSCNYMHTIFWILESQELFLSELASLL